MSILARGIGAIRGRTAARRVGPSVREVCLIGPAHPARTPGPEVEWGGRHYRVESSGSCPAGDGPSRYLHLAHRETEEG